jgi:hypothetical protein
MVVAGLVFGLVVLVVLALRGCGGYLRVDGTSVQPSASMRALK